MALHFDFSKVHNFGVALEKAPEILAEELTRAFQKSGREINEQVRSNVRGGLHLKTQGSIKVFKYKASDINKVDGHIGKVFSDWYTLWKAAKIFDTGGTVHPAIAGALTILSDLGRGKSGRRKWTSQQIVQMIHNGLMNLIKTPNGWIITQPKGGLTKTGKLRKGSRDDIIAILKKNVKETKRINYEGTIESGFSLLHDLSEIAVENALIRLEQESGKKK